MISQYCAELLLDWRILEIKPNHGNKQSGVVIALELSSSVISFEREERRARLCEFSVYVKECVEVGRIK